MAASVDDEAPVLPLKAKQFTERKDFYETVDTKPEVITALFEFTKAVGEAVETVGKHIVNVIGHTMKYVGLIVMIVGVCHMISVLMGIPLATLAAKGLFPLIFAWTESGAMPTLIAGTALYSFGKDLTGDKMLLSIYSLSWVFSLTNLRGFEPTQAQRNLNNG